MLHHVWTCQWCMNGKLRLDCISFTTFSLQKIGFSQQKRSCVDQEAIIFGVDSVGLPKLDQQLGPEKVAWARDRFDRTTGRLPISKVRWLNRFSTSLRFFDHFKCQCHGCPFGWRFKTQHHFDRMSLFLILWHTLVKDKKLSDFISSIPHPQYGQMGMISQLFQPWMLQGCAQCDRWEMSPSTRYRWCPWQLGCSWLGGSRSCGNRGHSWGEFHRICASKRWRWNEPAEVLPWSLQDKDDKASCHPLVLLKNHWPLTKLQVTSALVQISPMDGMMFSRDLKRLMMAILSIIHI